MKATSEDLKVSIAGKMDEELYDMLYVHSSDFTPDALQVAKDEFLARKIEAPKLPSLASFGTELKMREEAPLELPWRIIAFFVSTSLLFIPMLLAHRHYVEQGAKRKARDWVRWGLFGLVFYVVLSILGLRR